MASPRDLIAQHAAEIQQAGFTIDATTGKVTDPTSGRRYDANVFIRALPGFLQLRSANASIAQALAADPALAALQHQAATGDPKAARQYVRGLEAAGVKAPHGFVLDGAGATTFTPDNTANTIAASVVGLATGGALASGLGAGAAGTGGSSAAAAPTVAAPTVAAGTAAPVAATGGTALVPRLLQTGAQVAGQIEAGRTAGRVAENNADESQNNAAINNYRAQLAALDTGLEQDKFLSDEFDKNAERARKGGYLQGVEDVQITPPPGIAMGSVTGGARPSAIANKAAIGKAMQDYGTAGMAHPGQFNGAPLPTIPKAPDLILPPAPGGADTAMGLLGLAGAASPYIQSLIRNGAALPSSPSGSLVPAPRQSGPMAGVTFYGG